MAWTELSVEIKNVLDEYSEELDETVQVVMMQVAKETRDMLKKTSPKTKRTGKHYANGWAIKKEPKTLHVYNKTKPGLTHLLENGHLIRNQYGSYDHTTPQPHIKPAEEWANAEVMRRLTEKL